MEVDKDNVPPTESPFEPYSAFDIMSTMCYVSDEDRAKFLVKMPVIKVNRPVLPDRTGADKKCTVGAGTQVFYQISPYSLGIKTLPSGCEPCESL